MSGQPEPSPRVTWTGTSEKGCRWHDALDIRASKKRGDHRTTTQPSGLPDEGDQGSDAPWVPNRMAREAPVQCAARGRRDGKGWRDGFTCALPRRKADTGSARTYLDMEARIILLRQTHLDAEEHSIFPRTCS